MDKQENGEIKPIMLEEYLDNLKAGEKVVVCKLPNGNLNVYDECGEFKDNDIWSMKLD